MSCTVEQFQGKSGKTVEVIVLKNKEDDKYPFSFGVGKAKLILQHIDEIKKFVNQKGGLKN